MVHVFFPVTANPDWGQLAVFLAIGSAVGSIFALLSFLFSAFSLPMETVDAGAWPVNNPD